MLLNNYCFLIYAVKFAKKIYESNLSPFLLLRKFTLKLLLIIFTKFDLQSGIQKGQVG